MLACHLYQCRVTLFLSFFLEIQSHYPFCTLHRFMHFQDRQIFFWRFLPSYQLLITELSAGWRQHGIKRVLTFQNICNSSETAEIIHRMLIGRNLWNATSCSKQDYHQHQIRLGRVLSGHTSKTSKDGDPATSQVPLSSFRIHSYFVSTVISNPPHF